MVFMVVWKVVTISGNDNWFEKEFELRALRRASPRAEDVSIDTTNNAN